MNRWILALASFVPIGCSSDKADPPAAMAKPAADTPASAPAPDRAAAIANAPSPLGAGMTALEALGLQIALPPGSKLPPPQGSSYDIILPGSLFVAVKAADELSPKTLDEAKQAAFVYSPTNLRAESLPDGWIVQFESDAAGGHALWIQVRRKFGDKVYECSGNAFKGDDGAPIIAACKSLKR